MPLFDLFKSKKDETEHEALFADRSKAFEQAFKIDRNEKPIVVKQDGKDAESCDEVCQNMGKCNGCDLEF